MEAGTPPNSERAESQGVPRTGTFTRSNQTFSMSRYRAVVFDLWGALVDDLRSPAANRLRFGHKMDEMAELLGVNGKEFVEARFAGFDERMIGAAPTTEAALSGIAGNLGIEIDDGLVHAVAEVWYAYVRCSISPRAGTVETISMLRESGFKVGLISNCIEEFALLWDSTPFAPPVDAAVLSFEVDAAKPDPAIHCMASVWLEVSPERCLYIGDGADPELSGASEAGVSVVLMRSPYDLADGNRVG
ncbi:MAG: HAD family hydrolase [Chloroflexi bacterium]|nr:HAD family hydrolase [Chloroflexota bacterium]MYF78532.1 HAD family hydrolase [Chloroflexota bacterium]MYK61730.1 HAD family hydrolase [Chloroflexota bacterium]